MAVPAGLTTTLVNPSEPAAAELEFGRFWQEEEAMEGAKDIFGARKTGGGGGNGGGRGGTRKNASLAAIANLVAPFALGGMLGVLEALQPKWWRRVDPYTRAVVLAALAEVARRRNLQAVYGSCAALGSKYAAMHATRQIRIAGGTKKDKAKADDGQANNGVVGRLPLAAGPEIDEVIRRSALGQLPAPVGVGAGGFARSGGLVADLVNVAA